MKRHSKRIALFIAFIAFIAALQFSGVRDVITFENLQRNRDLLLAHVREHYALSVVSFIGVYAAATGLNIPVAAILTIASGFLFGLGPGTLYSNIGATTGASLSFLAARYLIGGWVQERFASQLAAFNREMEKDGTRYLLTIRQITVLPFFVVNFLSALTKVPLRTFVWTTSIGVIPAQIVFTNAGTQLGSIKTPGEILSWRVIVSFLLLALFAIIPVIWKRIRPRKKGA